MSLTAQQLAMIDAEAEDYEVAHAIRKVPPFITTAALAIVIGRLIARAAADETQLQCGLRSLFEAIRMTATNSLSVRVKH